MRIPPDAVIDETKLTQYLLVPRPWDDKSGYLRQAGFELKNWPDLLAAVRRLADTVDAVADRTNEYGTFYRVAGALEGPGPRGGWTRPARRGRAPAAGLVRGGHGDGRGAARVAREAGRTVTKIRSLIATWFGSGHAPVASGTFGTLATMPLVAALWSANSWPLHLAAIVAAVSLGLWAASDAEIRFAQKDPGQVVIDEVAGYLVTTFLVRPHAPTLLGWAVPLLVSFFAFRALDILKPWPARQLERLPGAVGIMLDDLFAGLYALALTHGALWAWQAWGWLR